MAHQLYGQSQLTATATARLVEEQERKYRDKLMRDMLMRDMLVSASTPGMVFNPSQITPGPVQALPKSAAGGDLDIFNDVSSEVVKTSEPEKPGDDFVLTTQLAAQLSDSPCCCKAVLDKLRASIKGQMELRRLYEGDKLIVRAKLPDIGYAFEITTSADYSDMRVLWQEISKMSLGEELFGGFRHG